MSATRGPATVGQCHDTISETDHSDCRLRNADVGFETCENRALPAGIPNGFHYVGFLSKIENHLVVDQSASWQPLCDLFHRPTEPWEVFCCGKHRDIQPASGSDQPSCSHCDTPCIDRRQLARERGLNVDCDQDRILRLNQSLGRLHLVSVRHNNPPNLQCRLSAFRLLRDTTRGRAALGAVASAGGRRSSVTVVQKVCQHRQPPRPQFRGT